MEAHLAHLDFLGRRPGTITQRRYCLGRLARWAAPTLLCELGRDDITAFITRPGVGSSTRAAEVSHVRGFFGWAHSEGLVEYDPSAHMRRPILPRRLPRPIPDDRLQVVLDQAPARVRHWMWLAAYAGLRCCEIAVLHSDDYHPDLGVLILRAAKGGDEEVVPVAGALADVLVGLPRGLWAPRWDGRSGHLSANMVSQHGNQVLHDLGVPDTMHSLRHWCGTWTYRVSGRDFRLTQEMLRHRSPSSTAMYTWVDPGELAEVADRLPTFGRRRLRSVAGSG